MERMDARRSDGMAVAGLRREVLARAWRAEAAAARVVAAQVAAWERALSALGAPRSLVAGARDALGEAREQERLCADHGTAPPESAPVPGHVVDLAVAIARDGAVAGTLRACVAAGTARYATAARDRAARIAEIEAARAELAWQVLGWAVAVGGAEVRDAVARVFAEPFRPPPGDGTPSDPVLRAHGLLAHAERVAIARDAHREVVGAVGRALLDRRAAWQ